jgi:hypothetical protein
MLRESKMALRKSCLGVTAMHLTERFHLVQRRAYEIYQHRDPNCGSADEDWSKAETEIEREVALAVPERKELARWSDFVSYRDKGTGSRT